MKLFIFITLMAVTTYLIRALPLTLFKKPVKNRFFRSFLAYVPCACLSVMTVPAILFATGSLVCGIAALAVALILALFRQSLVVVAAGSCAAVLLTNLILTVV
ncbi:MAG: AzlD domain-containing protein [Clostridia bacterium]|nr:AzlD domain-containing protein [Clostridia bacterium]